VNALDRLIAVEEIKKLKARYFRFIDTKDVQAFLDQFTEDVHWHLLDLDGSTAVEVHSRDEMRTWLGTMADAHSAGMSVHLGCVPEIEVLDDRTATGIWKMVDHVLLPGLYDFTGYGYYYEEYRKCDDGVWRIRDVRLERLHIDDRNGTPRAPENARAVR
jgi:SnoaL-like domain